MDIGKTYDRPLILESDAGKQYIAIAEARLVDFARMQLKASPERKNAIEAILSSKVTHAGDLRSPWRVIMAADSPGSLLENNDLILNLNDPLAIADTSWIKPGKVLREVTLSTEGAIASIDWASANGIEYVLFDAGWYGHEYDDASDATTITVDPKRSTAELDLDRAIRYGKERDVGIVLYVNRRALESQLDDVLPLYRKWGIAGVKYGFVQVGSQRWTTWLQEAVREAATHRLMVDVHDEYRPTGYSRTYPNLMTQEGIGGDETSPSPKDTLGILFPRLLAGAADNTVCYYDKRVKAKMNHSFQLAKTICIYSPWQFVFWYDRPEGSPHDTGGAGGDLGIIGHEPELEFFSHVPTVWDDTKVLEGSIEKYAVIARRTGDEWYVGAMNAGQARDFDVPLDFLDEGREYVMRSYTHDDAVETKTKVRIEERPVNGSFVLSIGLQADDGAAYRIMPVQPAGR